MDVDFMLSKLEAGVLVLVVEDESDFDFLPSFALGTEVIYIYECRQLRSILELLVIFFLTGWEKSEKLRTKTVFVANILPLKNVNTL
jgi:hypothetical protein